MKPPFVRNPYNYDLSQASNETGLSCPEPTLAVQDAAAECDINTIVRRFGLTGEMPQGIRAPTYGDFTGLATYQDAVNAIAQSHESFDALPAEVRAKFQNDPYEFVNFCSDEKNRQQLVDWGMVQSNGQSFQPAAPVSASSATANSSTAASIPPASAPQAISVPKP